MYSSNQFILTVLMTGRNGGLRSYTDWNPLPLVESSLPPPSPTVPGNRDNRQKTPNKNFMAGGNIQQPQSPPPCVYCGLNSHRSSDCTKVLDIASRREYLTRNKLCYNCARSGHLASKCKGRGCGKCKCKWWKILASPCDHWCRRYPAHQNN